jgi:hypothetical protein
MVGIVLGIVLVTLPDQGYKVIGAILITACSLVLLWALVMRHVSPDLRSGLAVREAEFVPPPTNVFLPAQQQGVLAGPPRLAYFPMPQFHGQPQYRSQPPGHGQQYRPRPLGYPQQAAMQQPQDPNADPSTVP